jgi:hypothetical protein
VAVVAVVVMAVPEIPRHVMAVVMVAVMMPMTVMMPMVAMMTPVVVPAAASFPLPFRAGESGIGSQKHRGTHGQHQKQA